MKKIYLLLIALSVSSIVQSQDNGDLETLLLQIVNKEKYNKSIECYEAYADCVKKISNKDGYRKELLMDKYKIFSYFRTYNGIVNAKEENRKFNSVYWNFTDEFLSPFENFFSKIFAKGIIEKE